MKRLGTLFTLAMSLLLVAPAVAQEHGQDMIYGSDYNLENVRPYGDVTTEYSEYSDETTGSIVLTHSTPTDQHANFDVVGPDGYWEHFDFSDDPTSELILDNLAAGLYSVSATDEGLELAHTLVEVRRGETATVSLNLKAWEQLETTGAFNGRDYYGTYEGYDTAYPGYPYGAYAVGDYRAYDAPDLGSIAVEGVVDGLDVVVTGPDGFSEHYSADTVIENLPPGVYVIAVTGSGTELAVTTVEVQAGQQLPLTPGTAPMSADQ